MQKKQYYLPDEVPVLDREEPNRVWLEYEKMLQNYPKEVQQLLEIVQKELDLQDYQGSFLYDEVPDRYQLLHMVDNIYRKMLDQGIMSEEKQDKEADEASVGEMGSEWKKEKCPLGSCFGNSWGKQLLQVLLQQEIHRRRCKRTPPSGCGGRIVRFW